MQYKLSFLALTLASLVGAAVAGKDKCETGPIQCCNTVGKSSDPFIASALASVGVAVDPDVTVGATCSPITVGVGSTTCSGQTVCCNDNNYEGVVAIGCVIVVV